MYQLEQTQMNAKRKLSFLGDTHGDFNIITEAHAIARAKDSFLVHVGDVGLGFPEITNVHSGKLFSRDPESFPAGLFFIRGNHDNPATCRKYENYLGDYGYNKELGIFYISGAWSIDVNYRTPDIDWWYEEELDYPDLQKAIDLYKEVKPEIVVAHTCPKEVAKLICGGTYYGSKTENALQSMWQDGLLDKHRPKYWIFGHWHKEWRKNILGTEFICCDINQIITLDL